MPLIKSPSKKAIGKNIAIEETEGNKPHKQDVAIALNVARKAGAKIKKKKQFFIKEFYTMGVTTTILIPPQKPVIINDWPAGSFGD